jgi:hypothetical protein
MKSLRLSPALAILSIVIAAALVVAAPPSRAATPVASTGTVTVLVMRANWGGSTSTVTPETVASVAGVAAEWVSTVSSGVMHATIDVYPDELSITEPTGGCQASKDDLMQQAKSQLRGDWFSPGGTNAFNYDDYVLFFPTCTESTDPESWATQGGQGIWLNAVFTVHDIVAGLGHNMGLTASNSRVCPTQTQGETCTVAAAGDPFDPMGAGSTAAFNAAEKNQLGWLAGTQKRDLGGGGTATLTPPNGTTSNLQAAFLTFGARTYWLEYRQKIGVDDVLPDEAVDGVLVHEVDSNGLALTNARVDDETGDIWTIPQGGSWVSHEGVRISVVAVTSSGASVTVSRPQLSVSKAGTGSGTVTSSPAGISCGTTCTAEFQRNSTVALTATPATGSTFAGWSNGCTGTGACSVVMASNQTVTATFNATAATTPFEESTVGLDGWSVVSNSGASGGSFRSSTTTGNTASFRFSGPAVNLVMRKGPQLGIARVTVNGVSINLDLFATADQTFSRAFTGLGTGAHTITVRVTGTKNASSSGFGVVVDAFTVGTTTTQDTARTVTYDTWKTTTATGASGGAYRATATRNATATLTFTGTGIDWITATGPNRGNAQVFIDNVSRGTFDQFATSAHQQVVRPFTGLSPGQHTIRVVVLGTKRTAATAATVAVDAFVVH